MKDSEIFELAAERLERGENRYCCVAIADVAKTCFSQAEQTFKELFKPEVEDKTQLGWWERDLREPRIIALLLAAEIARDKERKEARKTRKPQITI